MVIAKQTRLVQWFDFGAECAHTTNVYNTLSTLPDEQTKTVLYFKLTYITKLLVDLLILRCVVLQGLVDCKRNSSLALLELPGLRLGRHLGSWVINCCAC